MKTFTALLILLFATALFATDGTENWPIPWSTWVQNPGSCTRITDDVYEITPFESVCISTTNVWQDNRHRAYWSGENVNGFLLFDVTRIPDGDQIVSMTLLCYLENAFGSPMSNPIVDIYWSDDDNWTRMSATPNSLSLNDLLVNNIPFTSYVPSYTFTLNVAAHNWSQDLLDNRICLGFKNDVNYYSYVYFYGAYGAPVGPPPVLTITTTPGTPQDVEVDLTPYGLPIQIPANGGSFNFNIAVTNNETSQVSCYVWTMVTLPGGSNYGPILNYQLNLAPNFSGNRDRVQVVPANAPAGNYVYHAYVGYYPGTIWDEDSFPFSKLP